MIRKSILRSNILSSTSTPFFKKIFSSLPHSKEDLVKQQQAFFEKNINVKLTTLNKGQRFIGLDFNANLIQGAVPLYHQESLSKLSDAEKEKMIYMGKTYFARLADYEVLENITCYQGQTTHGEPIYYVNNAKTAMKNLRTIDSVLSEIQTCNPMAFPS